MRADVKPARVILFGPSGISEFPGLGINGGANARTRLTAVHIQGSCVVISGTFGPDTTVCDFEAAVRGLQPIIDSIRWE